MFTFAMIINYKVIYFRWIYELAIIAIDDSFKIRSKNTFFGAVTKDRIKANTRLINKLLIIV